MPKKIVPFFEGPTREKKVLSLGFYRTGSQSLKEALTILGYRNVFHSSVMARDVKKWDNLGDAADANVHCLPSYTGRTYTREDWEVYFGPCEALTDVTPFADSLLKAYPDALVILVHRDFDSWATSFLNTLVLPSSDTILAKLSGNLFEPLMGFQLSKTAWKMYMGLIGVCDLRKTTDRNIMRAGYDRHYEFVRRSVPPERLLELDLKDLDWEPLCKFLDKDVPDMPFPRLNESSVFRNEFKRLHRMTFMGGSLILLAPIAVVVAIVWFAWKKV